MTDCIFCNIVAGEIPNYTIYEDDDYLAFLDISQIVDGHTLVIPKKHVRWVWDAPDIGSYFEVVCKVAKHMRAVSESGYVKSITLGVLVEHAHVHLLPDTGGSFQLIEDAWINARQARKLTPSEMEILHAKFVVKNSGAD